MQNAGQFGPGAASTHPATQFVPSEPSPNGGSTTSSLRQFRKKDVDKSQVEQQAPKQMSESHVARVAPHSHYPPVSNDAFRFTSHQFSSYSPQVKYPDLAEPSQSNPISTSVIQKPKPKDYMELCNVQQQHLNSHQQYSPDNGPYMHKEPVQGYPAGYKPESHFFPKEQHQYQQLPHHPGPPKFNTMVTQNMRKFNPAPADNPFLDKLSKLHPSMARSIISDHHLQDNQPTYPPIDQPRGMYGQQNHRYYSGPPMHQSNPYSPTHNYAPINTPHPYSNYPSPTSSCNYSRPSQMGPVPPRYSQMERSMSPGRRACVEGMHLPHMNYHPMHQKMAMGPNYSPQYRGPEYAQHYQHRRMPQECFPQSCRPVQFMQNHHQIPGQGMQELSENTVSPSDSLKKFIENWADEEPSADININPMEASLNLREKLRDDAPPGTVYMINATDVQYFENNGIPIVTSDNGGFQLTSENYQYLVKNGLVDNSGMVRIIEANKEVSVDSNGNQERVVNLQIMEATKSDCMMVNKHMRPNDGALAQNNPITKPENDTRRVVIHQNTILQPGHVGASDTIAQQPVDQVPLSQSAVDNLGITKELVDKNCSPINLDHLEHNLGFNEPEPPETESASAENNSKPLSPNDPNISNDQHLNEMSLSDDLSQSSDSSQYKSPGSKSMPIIDFFGEAHVQHDNGEPLRENEKEDSQSINEDFQRNEQEVTNGSSSRELSKEVKIEENDCKPEFEPLANALINGRSDVVIATPDTVKTEPSAEILENSSEAQSKSNLMESGDAVHEEIEVLQQRKRIFSVDDIIHNIGNDMKRCSTDPDDVVYNSNLNHNFIEREVEFSSFEQLDSVATDRKVDISSKPVIVNSIKVETDGEPHQNTANSIGSPLLVEGHCIFLQMSGVLMEIKVNTVSGKKVINVRPLCDSTIVVDHNDNYEISGSVPIACNKNMNDENSYKDTEDDSVKNSEVVDGNPKDVDSENGLENNVELNAETEKQTMDKNEPTEYELRKDADSDGSCLENTDNSSVETREVADRNKIPEHELRKGVDSEDSLENSDDLTVQTKKGVDGNKLRERELLNDGNSEESLENNGDLNAETKEAVDRDKPPEDKLRNDVNAVNMLESNGDLSVERNENLDGNTPPERDLPKEVEFKEHFENDDFSQPQTETEEVRTHVVPGSVVDEHIEEMEVMCEVTKPGSPTIHLSLPKEEIKMEATDEPTHPVNELSESCNKVNQFESLANLNQGEASDLSAKTTEDNIAEKSQKDVAENTVDNSEDLPEYEDTSSKCFKPHNNETLSSQPDTVEADRNSSTSDNSAKPSVISLNDSDVSEIIERGNDDDDKLGVASIMDLHSDDNVFEKQSCAPMTHGVDVPEGSVIINQPTAMEKCSNDKVATQCEEKIDIIENNIAEQYQDDIKESSADLDEVKEISDSLLEASHEAATNTLPYVNDTSELLQVDSAKTSVQLEPVDNQLKTEDVVCDSLRQVDDNLRKEDSELFIDRDEVHEDKCLYNDREAVDSPIMQLESVDEIIMSGPLADQVDDLTGDDERLVFREEPLVFPLEDEVFIAEPPALEFIVSDPLDLGALEVRGSPEIPLEPVTTTEELIETVKQPEEEVVPKTIQPEVQILSPTSTNIEDHLAVTKNNVYSKRKYSTDNDVSECATSSTVVTKAAKKLYESDLRVQHDIVSSSKKEIVPKTPSKNRKPGTKKSKRLNEKAQAKTEQKEVLRLLVEKRKRREELRQKESKEKRPEDKRTSISLDAGRSPAETLEHDDEYVDFKELLRARKLKKMKKLEELKTQQAENSKSDKSQLKPGNSHGPREKVHKDNDCCVGCRDGADAKPKIRNDKKFVERRSEPEVKKGSKPVPKITHEKIRMPKRPSFNDDRPSSTSNIVPVENKNAVTFSFHGLHPKDPRRKPRTYATHIMVPSVSELIEENAGSGSKKKISLADYVSRKRKAMCADNEKNKTGRNEEGEKRLKLDTERTVSQQGASKTMKDVKTSFVIHSSDWEDSNSPAPTPESSKEDCLIIYDFSGLIMNNSKKPVIDINELTPPLENSKDRKLQEYKDKVDSQLSSLNIQIPKIKPHALDGKGGSKSNWGPYDSPKSSSLVARFLKNEKLSQSEMEKIRKIISYKRSMQHQKNGPSPSKSSAGVERRRSVSFVENSPDPTYEVRSNSRVEADPKEVRLHFKKVNAKRKLPPINDENDSSSVISNESEAGHKKPDGYSVINRLGEDGLPKIIFKRNRESGFAKEAVVELVRLDLNNLEKVKEKYHVTVSQMMM